MEKTRAVITSHLGRFKEFEYYFSIIEIAEESINKKPDVTIDCCKSLIEGNYSAGFKKNIVINNF